MATMDGDNSSVRGCPKCQVRGNRGPLGRFGEADESVPHLGTLPCKIKVLL